MSCNEKSSINIKDLTVSTIISYIISNILSYIFSNILPHIYGNQILLPLPEIPFYIYGILLTPLIFLILRKCIHSKMNEGIKDQIYFATTYKPIAKMKYNNMIWIIEKDINYPQSIHVDYTPRCPKCGAELYFQKHDLWYSYDCVNPRCRFIKRTLESEDKMRTKVKMIYKHESCSN